MNSKQYDKIPGMFIIKGEPDIVTETRAKILDKFKDLKFYEGPHIYELNGKKLTSVTKRINEFVSEKDWDGIAERYAEKNGETKEYWQDKWKFNNLKSTTTGTLVHAYGESYFYLVGGHPEFITEDNKCKYIKDRNWLIPTRPKEEAIMKFYKELNPNLHLVLAECKMFTESLKKNLAGTADILFYYDDPKSKKSGFCIFDWKTNAELIKEGNRKFGNMLLPPFNDMVEEPLSEYKLQLNIYSIPLQDLGIDIIARRIVWLKDNGDYELIPIDDYSDKIRKLL